MNTSGVRFETLSKENYDTWKIQMRAMLIKNDAWGYVSGAIVKPESTADNAHAEQTWINADSKAQSDIILAIQPSEIKQIKGCETSRAVWTKKKYISPKDPYEKPPFLISLYR